VWLDKDCSINLGYYTGNKWNMLGTVPINLAPMVEKGDETKVYTMECTHPLISAKCEATFRVDTGNTGSIEKAEHRATTIVAAEGSLSFSLDKSARGMSEAPKSSSEI